MPNILHDAVLAVDLGKTSCRVRLSANNAPSVEAQGIGAPGLAETRGADDAFDAIWNLIPALGSNPRIGHIGVGAAGVEADPAAALSLAKRLADCFHAPVAVINDALAAHVGAFGGRPGTILIAGTGAIAFTLGTSGPPRQVDGWGPLLGDDGSGRWIGQEGLKAALRDHDKRSGPTSLTDVAAALAGDLGSLPRWVSDSGHDARRLASFAPTVLQHAGEGDPTARRIITAAAQHLADTVEAAGDRDRPLSVVGGLYDHPTFGQMLDAELGARGFTVAAPVGSPLDGAELIAIDNTLPHESRIIRV